MSSQNSGFMNASLGVHLHIFIDNVLGGVNDFIEALHLHFCRLVDK